MTYGEKVCWLDRYLDCMVCERELAMEVQELQTQAEHITPLLTGMPGSGPSTNRLPRQVEKILAAKEELQEKIGEATRLRAEISAALDEVEDARARTLLRERYLLGYSFERLAEERGVEYRWIRRLHHRAVDRLEAPAQAGILQKAAC